MQPRTTSFFSFLLTPHPLILTPHPLILTLQASGLQALRPFDVLVILPFGLLPSGPQAPQLLWSFGALMFSGALVSRGCFGSLVSPSHLDLVFRFLARPSLVSSATPRPACLSQHRLLHLLLSPDFPKHRI